MNLKKINKINEKLAGDFNLIPIFENDWVLQRMDITGRIVLNSGKNTEEELDKFVKEHKTYNFFDSVRIELLVINILALLLCVINTFIIHSDLISGIVIGMLLVLVPLLLTEYIVVERNYIVRKKIREEDFAAYKEARKKALKDMTNIDKKHTRKTSSTKTPRKKANTKGEEKKD